MKLINVDDLKEYAQKLLVGEPINTQFGINLYKMFEEIIDHTPTVEVPENNERSQGDLISRSELKKVLCEFMKNNIGIYSNEMFHLVDSMPTVEEKSQSEWIPVSERLPEFTGLYLVSIDNLVTAMSFDGTGFMNRSGVRIEVDAWMSLPKSYKKGGAE